MSQLTLLGLFSLKAVNTLTPIWLLGIGAFCALVLIGIFWGALAAAARWIPKLRFLARLNSELMVSSRRGILSWGLTTSAVLALVGISGTFLLRSPGDSFEILSSLKRLPQVGMAQFSADLPGSRAPENEDDIVVPPVNEVAVSFSGAELRSLEIESTENVSVSINAEAEMDSLDAIDVKADEKFTWRQQPSTKSPFGEESVSTLFFRNRGTDEAWVTVTAYTDVVHPEVRAIPITAVGVFSLFLLYVLQLLCAPRLTAVAHATFKSEIAQPQFVAVLVLGLALLVLSIYIPYNTFGEDNKMLKDSGLTLIRVLCIFLAIWGASTTISDEIDGKTALTVLSKPISRRSFVVGKFFGISWTTALMYVLLGLVFLVVVSYKMVYDARETGNELPSWQTCHMEMVSAVPGLFLGFMETLILVALSVAISTRLSMIANFMICFSIYVLGHLIPLISQVTEDRFEIVKFVGRFSAALFPNLQAFDMQTALAGGIAVRNEYLAVSFLYCFIFSLVAMLLALIMFEDRDLA